MWYTLIALSLFTEAPSTVANVKITSVQLGGPQLGCGSVSAPAKGGEKPQLAKAFKMLIPIAKEWQNIGILLGLKHQDLKSIDTDGDSDINHLREMLILWLSSVDRPPWPSWEALAEAVELFDTQIAAKIKATVLN